MFSCEDIVRHYVSWLGQRFVVKPGETKNVCIVETPFVNPLGDHIEIEVKRTDNNSYELSDGGVTSDFLFLMGASIDGRGGDYRKQALETILEDYNLKYVQGELKTNHIDEANLAPAIQCFLTAIGSLSYLAYTAQSRGIRTFKEEVIEFLTKHDITVLENYPLRGRIKERYFDAVIPNGTYRVVQALSSATSSYARTLAIETWFMVNDVREAQVNITAIAVIDDSRPVWAGESMDILKLHLDHVIQWSMEKENILSLVQRR